MRTVEWREGKVRLIDQRVLPAEFRVLELETPEEVARAIREMAVRGAPAIGAAAAFGLALAARRSRAVHRAGLWRDLEEAAAVLRAARPTAVNLAWALERVLGRCAAESDPDALRDRVLAEAQAIADEDVEVNRRLGEVGAAIVPDGATILHHCNTGALATVDYGTALGVIRTAHEQGKRVHVLVDETRPLLQGARLTAWELQRQRCRPLPAHGAGGPSAGGSRPGGRQRRRRQQNRHLQTGGGGEGERRPLLPLRPYLNH
jgi:methylthioribose-1-phosphate isomerase